MKLCVVGMGRVGMPLMEMLRNIGHSCVGYDCHLSKSEVTAREAVERSEAALFVVQTPSLESGAFDNSHLEAALQTFAVAERELLRTDYLHIIVSTVVPGSCEKFKAICGPRVVYNPLFIRLEHIDLDLINPDVILIGSTEELAGLKCQRIYKCLPGRRCHMSLIEAELAKITLNCALTMKISLANQLHLVASKLGADSSRIMDCVGSDPRIGHAYLIPGRPYEGPCLPRDNRMFRFVAESVGVNAALSEAADKINQAIGTPSPRASSA